MDHVVAIIHPFVLMQEVSVYKNGECTKTVECPLKDIEDTLYTLCKENDINNVDISGGQLYGMKIKEHFVANKFDNSDKITVNIY